MSLSLVRCSLASSSSLTSYRRLIYLFSRFIIQCSQCSMQTFSFSMSSWKLELRFSCLFCRLKMCPLRALFSVSSSTMYCCRLRMSTLWLLIICNNPITYTIHFTLATPCQITLNFGWIIITMQSEHDTEATLITGKHTNKFLKLLSFIDIFSFLPIPTDQPVSTRRSIFGSLVIIVIFLAYVITDLVQFLTWNRPVLQIYRSPLDESTYILPDIAIAFMTNQNGTVNNYTELYDNLFTYQWSALTKSQGSQKSTPVDNQLVTYLNSTPHNFNLLPWLDDPTKQFYYILRTPVPKDIPASGLLFSSSQTTYLQVKASFCRNVSNISCLPQQSMTELSNYGRFFLFIEDEVDNSTVSVEGGDKNTRFQLFNFYTIPNFYKRITIKFSVVKTEILPDYFFRFRTEYNLRLQVDSVFEEISVVNSIKVENSDAIGFNFQLASQVLNNRVTYQTLIDHISLWSAFFGVIFSFSALVFLNFNRQKFYKRNPDWSHFKEALNSTINRTHH